jgi:hypothetical protein
MDLRLGEIMRGRIEELEALAVEMSRTFDSQSHSAVCCRARPPKNGTPDHPAGWSPQPAAWGILLRHKWGKLNRHWQPRLSRNAGARARGAAVGGIWGLPAAISLIYVFVEGLAVLAVLAGCGVLADGNRVLVHLAPRTKEDAANCRKSFQDLRPGLPDRLAPRGSKGPEEGRFGGNFSP